MEKDKAAPVTRVIAFFGGISATARAFGKHRQEVQRWNKDGFIPFRHGAKVEALTNGEIKAAEVYEAAANHPIKRVK